MPTAGIKLEPKDWMPEACRKTALCQISLHSHSEYVGMLPEGNWTEPLVVAFDRHARPSRRKVD